MSPDYTAGKFEVAIMNLAAGHGDLRQRLRAAWEPVEMLRPDDPDHFPDDFPTGELRLRFLALRSEMRSGRPAGDEGSITATLAAASDEAVERWSQEFVDIGLEIINIDAQSVKR